MGAIASQITSLTVVYSTVYSDADQRKHQRSASLAFVWGIHRGPLYSPHKWPVTRKMFPFDDVIMLHKDVTRASRPSFWPLNNSFIRLRTKKNLHIDGLCEGNPFPWMKILFSLQFHWSLFQRVQITTKPLPHGLTCRPEPCDGVAGAMSASGLHVR